MGKLSSHYLSFISCMIIYKYIFYVIIIGWLKSHSTFGVMSIEILNKNLSATLNDILQSSTVLPMTSTISQSAFDVATSNTMDGVPFQGWQYHCWNSTNGSEVIQNVYIFKHVQTCVLFVLFFFILLCHTLKQSKRSRNRNKSKGQWRNCMFS